MDCPSCNRFVSNEAAFCPRCGQPHPAERALEIELARRERAFERELGRRAGLEGRPPEYDSGAYLAGYDEVVSPSQRVEIEKRWRELEVRRQAAARDKTIRLWVRAFLVITALLALVALSWRAVDR